MLSRAKSNLRISDTARQELGKNTKRTITSFSEICPSSHKLCKAQAAATGQLYSKYGKIPDGVYSYGACPVDTYTKFQVTCKNCGEDLAIVYAKDATLQDWRRCRYAMWHDDKYWHGLRGLNIKDDIIRFECSCDPENRKLPNEFIVKGIA